MRHAANHATPSSSPAPEPPRRRLVPRASCVAVAAIASLLALGFLAASASAANLTFVGNFSMTGVPGGSLNMTRSSKLAVDEATGDVYVIDVADDVVDRFDSDGNYLSQITGPSTIEGTFGFSGGASGSDDVAVDNSGSPTSQGDLYVWARSSETLFAFDAAGTERWATHFDGIVPGSGDTACGLGVDNAGNPWLGDRTANAAVEIDPSDGSPTGASIATSGAHPFCHLAFDNENSVYMTGPEPAFERFNANPTLGASFDATPNDFYYAIATSPNRNDIFTGSLDGTMPTITQWDSAGGKVSTFTGNPGTDEFEGVALDGTRNRLFVSDVGTGVVQIYTVTPQPPRAEALVATSVGIHTVTLNGMVNPNGSDVTGCHFAYGTLASGSFDHTAPCVPGVPISGASAKAVTADVSGLSPATQYQYELVATNDGGATTSNEVLFETEAAPDADGDGVPDELDACPAEAGTQPNGCPPPMRQPTSTGGGGSTSAGGGGGGGGATTLPPAPAPQATYGQCVKSANGAYQKALKAAERKHGKARARAVHAARARKGKLVIECKKRFHKPLPAHESNRG